MSRFPSLEGSSLKRKGNIPPDVYCQRNEQKEDILSEDFVRDGFKYMKPVRDEYESCREESKFVNADALWNFFYTVMTHKYEYFGDQDLKKRQASIRDSVVPVIDMNKARISDWFKELAGSVALQTLKRRVPFSKDKDEILGELLSNKVPVSRALWFINTSIIQMSAMAENTKKKRAPLDPTVEWTTSVCRKLTSILENTVLPELSSNITVSVPETDWNYFFSLLIAMYNVAIADRWEVLVWLVKTAEGLPKLTVNTVSSPENSNITVSQMDNQTVSPPKQQSSSLPRVIFTDNQPAMLLKFFLFQLLRVGNWFRESELLSRRLLYWCCNILHDIVFTSMPDNVEYSSETSELSKLQQEVVRAYASAIHTCPLHAIVVSSLSGLIACLVCNCPAAAVWNSIPIETEQIAITGSPLDFIPLSLVYLPMPPGCESTSIRKCLGEIEKNIITRGRLVQLGWNRQAMTSRSNGEVVERIVRLLDILDGQDYYILKEINPMEALYNRIFKDDAVHADTGAVVTLLCEWAVSPHRIGIHRPIIVACILEHLVESFRSEAAPRRLLQATFVNFLDSYTKFLPNFTAEQAPIDNESMRNLVCLFAELIDRELFDHDAYVRHFIARGAFDIGSQPPLVLEISVNNQSNVVTAVTTASVYTLSGSQSVVGSVPLSSRGSGGVMQLSTGANSLNTVTQCSVASELSEDNDRCSVENPDSVRSELGFSSAANMGVTTQQQQSHQTSVPRSGHVHYLVQLPIPQDEAYSHEQNQRSRLLYGSVRMRDRARSRVRRLFRDIVKMLTRKAYLIDVVHGEVYRRRKPKERDRDKEGNASLGLNTSAILSTASVSAAPSNQSKSQSDEARSIEELHQDIRVRFLSLSFYDMECVISQCTPTLVKVLNGWNAVPVASNAVTGSNSFASTTTASFASLPATEDININLAGNASANPASPSMASNFANNSSNCSSLSYIYMPVPSSIFLFFELIETSSNITCLIATIVDTLEKLHTLFESRTQFMTLYMSALCLRAIGLFQRYQPVLLTMGDLSYRLFRTLIAQVRQVKEPTQCGPFERCVLAYLNDLFNSSVLIKTKFTVYGKVHHKVAALFRSAVIPGEVTANFDPNYASELLNSVSSDNLATFRACAEDLRTNAQCRFSFVCRAIICVCQAKTNERLGYLRSLCAEMTSQCGELTSEWLRALYAVLASRPYPHGYSPLVELSDLNMYDSLSSLVGTLLSRYCFTISDFLCLVICPAMAQGLDHAASPVGTSLEPVIRLACHILHRLFTAEFSGNVSTTNTTSSSVQTPNQQDINGSATVSTGSVDIIALPPVFRISEPLLLTGALQKVTSEFLIDLLKLLIVHSDKTAMDSGMPLDPNSVSGDSAAQGSDSDDQRHPHGDVGDEDGGAAATGDVDSDEASLSDDYHRGDNDVSSRRRRGKASSNSSRRKQSGRQPWHTKRNQIQASANSPPRAATVRTVNHPVVQRFLEYGTLPTTTELQGLPLGGLIQLVLREICTASWVRERFTQMSPEFLTRDNVLIDKNFSHSQARHLLHIICSPYDLTWTDIALSSREGLASAMCSVLSSLNQWSMRSVQMKVELLKAQINFSQQSEVLGHVAQSLVHGFQMQALSWLTLSDSSGLFIDGSVGPIGGLPNFEVDENDKVWLLPSLMVKLPRAMKIPIVKATLEMLKGIRHFWKHKNDEDKETVLLKHSIILAHPAFFALLQLCIQDHDPIYDMPEQIDYFVQNARETEDRVPDNLRTRQVVQECLRLRLTLVGQRFETIQSDPDVCSRWALLLTQLITHGVTEPESNSTLFYMVIDMLQTLIHTLVARSGLDGKHYLNVVKKIRRELAERPSCSGIERIRPLLMPSKAAYSLFVTGRRSGAGSSTGVGGSGSLSGSGGVQSLGGTGSGSGGGGSGGGGGMGKFSGAGKSSFKVGPVSSSSKSGGNQGNQINARNRRGYTVIKKECFAPWELLDPNKQSSLLLKHGAIRTEVLPSHADEQANRLIIHDHYTNTRRKPQFYLCSFYPETEEVQSAASLNACSSASSADVNHPSDLANDALSSGTAASAAQPSDAAVWLAGPGVDVPPKRLCLPEKDENRIRSSHAITSTRSTNKLSSQGQADPKQFHPENTGSLMVSHGSVRAQMPLASNSHHLQQHTVITSKANELDSCTSFTESCNRSTRQIQQQQLLDPSSVQTMQDYHGCDMHTLSSGQHLMQTSAHASDMNYPLSAQADHFVYDQPQPTAVFNHPAVLASDGRTGSMQQSSTNLPTSTATTTSSMMMIVMDRGYQDVFNQGQQPPHAQHIVGSDSAIPSKTVKYMPSTRIMPGQLIGMATPSQEVHVQPHQQRHQTQSVAMAPSSSVTQQPPAKRKRGSGRRSAAAGNNTSANLAVTSTSTTVGRGGFRAASQHQIPTESHPFIAQPGAAYEFPPTTAVATGAGGDEDVWFVKSESNLPCLVKPDMRGRGAGVLPHQQMSKNAGHSANLAGFLRNRGRQQQQQVASVQQKHHIYPGSFSQAQHPQQHLDLNRHHIMQPSDNVIVPNQPFVITEQDTTSFAYSINSDVTSSTFNESGIVGSQISRNAMSVGKPQPIHCDPVTYLTQAMPPTVQTTVHPQTYRLPPQATPNPPPYPITSHQAHLGQQHAFHSRSTADDAYFVIMEPPGCEDMYQQQQAQRQQVNTVYPVGGHTQGMSHQIHHQQHHHLQPHQQTLVAQEQMHMMPGGTVCLANNQPCHQPLMVNTRAAQQQPLTLMTMVPANAAVATVVSQTPSKIPTTAAHPQQVHYSQYPNF